MHSTLRIHLDMPVDGPLARAIKQVLPSEDDEPTHIYVDSAEEADLIIDAAMVTRSEGLIGLAAAIGWVREPSRLPPLNSDHFIMRVLGKEKAESVWCAAHA